MMKIIFLLDKCYSSMSHVFNKTHNLYAFDF